VVVVGKPNPTDGMNWKKHHRSGKHPCQVNHRDGIYLLLDPLNCFRILFMYNLIRNKNNIFQWTGSLLYLPRKKHTNCSDSLRHWVKLRQDVNLRKSKYQLPIQWWVLYKQSTERQKKGGSYTGRRGGGEYLTFNEGTLTHPPIILCMGLTKKESVTENYCSSNCYLGPAIREIHDYPTHNYIE